LVFREQRIEDAFQETSSRSNGIVYSDRRNSGRQSRVRANLSTIRLIMKGPSSNDIPILPLFVQLSHFERADELQYLAPILLILLLSSALASRISVRISVITI
jgi:hypothetical protein